MPLVVGVVGVLGIIALVVMLPAGRTRVAEGPRDAGVLRDAGRTPTTLPPVLDDGGIPQLLTGTVVDASGQPVAGAELAALLEPDATQLYAAVSGPDGTFTVAVAEAGRYKLSVSGAGLVPAELRYVAIPGEALRVVVARQVRIDGKVMDGNRPLVGATVGLRSDAIGGGISTTTDRDGAFHFPELPEGRYQIYAWKEQLVARTQVVPRYGAGPFLPVELRVELGSILVGRVVDRDEGIGLAAAVELRASVEGEAPRYARSGDDGVFRVEGLPAGAWIADAYAPGFLSPGAIELAAGQGVPELSLVRGGVIEGRVVDAEGTPIAGASVRALIGTGASASEHSAAVEQDRLRRFSGVIATSVGTTGVAGADPQLLPRGELGVLIGPIPPIPPPGATIAVSAALDPTRVSLAAEPEPLPVAFAQAPTWTTGTDGRYRITGLPKGRVTAAALLAGLAEGRSRAVALEAGAVMIDVDIVLAAGAIIVGTVTDQHGVPVPGATVRATPEAGRPIDAFVDSAGAFTLGPLIGAVELVASARGHTSASAQVTLPAAKGLTPSEVSHRFVLVVADAVFAGLIDDAAGAIVDAATLEVLDGPAAGRRAVAGSDGTFVIDMLPPGALRVRVTHPDYPPVELEGLAAARGAPTARLRMPLGGAVEGVVLDATTGAPMIGVGLTGTGPGGAATEVKTDAQGRFRLGPLAPGAWKLATKPAGYVPAAREVDVTATREPGGVSVRDVRIDLERGALLAGTVRDARGQRIVGATIVAQRADGTGPRAEAIANSQGEFRIKDAPAGDLTITATKGTLVGEHRVTMRAGTQLLTMELTVR